MDESQLISELLEALSKDVKTLHARVEKLPTQPPTDYKTSIEELTKAVQELRNGSKQAPPAVDFSPITGRLDRLEQIGRQRPEYRMSQYVRYGGYAFGLMVVLVAGLTWLALDWKGERDQFRAAYWTADWRVRYLKQQDPNFYSYIEGLFAKDPAGVSKWVVEQEQADEKRALAAQAAEQAKALSDQANQLEGKPRVKGKKKG